MNIFTLVCSLIIGIYLIGLFFNFKILTHINIYFSMISLGYIVILVHIINQTWPIDSIILIIIGCLLLLFKHRVFFRNKQSLQFLKRLFPIIYKIALLTCILVYISQLPIVSAIALWLASIALSALFTFIIYVSNISSYQYKHINEDYKYILVLGAGIFNEQVPPMLANRLDQALNVYKLNPQSHFIVSGGKGEDEPISEALAMQRYLHQQGVPNNRIIMENQSTNTYENIKFTKRIISERETKSADIICVTSQFHIMRALRLGQKLKLKFHGLGSHTPYHFLEYAMIRDFLALMFQYKRVLTVYFALLFFATVYIK